MNVIRERRIPVSRQCWHNKTPEDLGALRNLY